MEISQDSLRVASFSAYLNPVDQDSFALKIATVVQEAVPAGCRSFEETPRAVSFSRRCAQPDKDSEIFGVNKYLNIKMEYKSSKATDDQQKELGAPSVCSRRIKPKRTNGLRFFIKGFSCRGPCSGNKSDHVDRGMVLEYSTSKRFQNQDDVSKKLTEEPRKSIEVFGSQAAAAKKGDDISKNLERKLSMLTWDAIPKKPHRLNPSISIEADTLSDTSSDLFEIEALSGTGQPPYDHDLNVPISLPAADEVSAGCMTPTTQYEPSEVSIDFSFASDFDDRAGKAVDLNLIKKRGGS